MELDREPLFGMAHDSAELVDEVHVPRGSAELAVRRDPQPDVLLHLHRLADRVVLDRPQLTGVDSPRRAVFSALQERGWAEQAAHVVGAKRWCRAEGHAQPCIARARSSASAFEGEMIGR